MYGNIARYFGKKREEDGHTHQWTVYLKPFKNEVSLNSLPVSRTNFDWCSVMSTIFTVQLTWNERFPRCLCGTWEQNHGETLYNSLILGGVADTEFTDSLAILFEYGCVSDLQDSPQIFFSFVQKK